ncbi:hypothetical protein VJ918_00605 [Adlercreutzia sp. R21]|nr:hypothetical protein [Adlercreutzia sp. R21]
MLRELTGYALSNIGHTEKMRDIPFGTISSLARQAFDDYVDISNGLYVPFCKNGELAKKYRDFASYRSAFQNIFLIAQGIELIALQIDIETMEMAFASNPLCQTKPSSLLLERKKLLLVRISKFHEHVTDRTMQYEDIARYYVNRMNGKSAWENAYQEIGTAVAKIMSDYTIFDSSIS